ncbi:sphingosine kinase 1-like isoform X1 [Phoenix dactylifera]|uniref:sphingosine kinase n=1 Tax=Phoenix dactylifera TaxID=42345 RepID=A0A8B9AMT9_PHODC|nr:sphingosine kinase 1-like isoform X1 [Phoenix dactylifera]
MEGKAGALTLTKRIRVNGVPAEASLAADGTLRWRAGDGGERCLAVESEVLGFEAEGQRITLRAFVGASRGASCGGVSFGKRTRRDYVLELPTEEPVLQWSQRLRDCIKSLGRPKRLFIIVNPFGGKKSGRKIFHCEVKPLLVAADILYTMQETKYQLHAQEIARSLGLLKYDGIVCVSGDGVLVEVVNGLLQREDWDTAIKVPLGIIPAGTGNGMAKSLLDSVGDLYSVSNATFAVIRGHKRTLDVATVLQGEKKFFSVLMLTWGLVADIDIESEKYRWMGSARLDFYSLLRMMNLRRYHGHVQFVPAPGYESYGEPIKQNGSDMGNTVLPEQGRVNNAEVKSCGYPGPVASFDGLEWRSIDGPFISVWINNVPWAGEDIMPAPEAKFSDGCLDAAILRDCPKSALLGLMLKMSDGSYLKSPYVIYLKVKAFRLKPGQRVGNPTKGGIVDSDGEVIAMGDRVNGGIQQEYRMSYGPPLQLTVDQGLATIFSPR